MKEEATIFAMATAPGRAGVAIVRVSGPAAHGILKALTGRVPAPRVAERVSLRTPRARELLDKGLALWFPRPNSYTGEDVVEFHVHGGRAIIAGLCDTLGEFEGVRLAEPGEFTRRAFQNGKLDLTEVEAVADLVEAETAAQRRQALRQLNGELGRRCEDWRKRLLRALALAEAAIDFSEEGLPGDLVQKALEECEVICGQIEELLADGRRGQRLREGLLIAIVGPPNAGKSSLLNLLAQRDVAITSAVEGTTRDVLEVDMDLGGFPVTLADTAGLRSTLDPVEEEGVRRARLTASKADLKLLVLDASRDPGDEVAREMEGTDTLVLVNKIDLAGSLPGGVRTWPEGCLGLSVKTEVGVQEFLNRLQQEVSSRLSWGGLGPAVVTRARHREALTDTLAALGRAPHLRDPELMAEELRIATRCLGRITGKVDVEDVLDLLFKEFCIGK